MYSYPLILKTNRIKSLKKNSGSTLPVGWLTLYWTGGSIASVYSACRDYGIEEPEFLEIGDHFRVNFYRLSFHKQVHQSSLKNLKATQESISENLIETQVFMSERLGITGRAVKKSIKDLTDRGILERERSTRKGIRVILDIDKS